MPNNPIHPHIPPKPVNEVPTEGNAFTDNFRNELPDDPEIINQVASETTGKKLTREEQEQFIRELPDDLLVAFAKRVQEHIQTEAVSAAPKKAKLEYVTDFATMREQSVFDLNIPIQAIDHQIPEYLDIKLRDPNFAPRWIQTSSKRLGTAISQGWAYITKEDLEEHLHVEIEPDSSGHYVYIDTVAMKIPKQKLYSQLRANYLRAIQITQQSKLHEKMKATIENEISSAMDPNTGLPLHDNFERYKSENKMNVYAPLAK